MIAQECKAHVLCTCKEFTSLHEMTFVVGAAGETVGSIVSKLASYMQNVPILDSMVVSYL